jgi:RimJ/RimL family protein N-acetyltransferase
MESNVALRDVTDDDLPILFEHQLDPEASRMAAFAPRDREAFMAHWAKILPDRSVLVRTIVVDGQVAGNIVSFDRLGEREVGYWIGRDHWGKGIATAALAEFLLLDANRPLYARVARQNVPSIRVLEKCGFTIAEDGSAPTLDDGVEEVVLKLDP